VIKIRDKIDGEVFKDLGKGILIIKTVMIFSCGALITAMISFIIFNFLLTSFSSYNINRLLLILMVPLSPICLFSFIIYIKLQEKYREQIILKNIDIIHSYLGENIIFSTESDIISHEIGRDPIFTVEDYNSIKANFMIAGEIENIVIKAFHLEVKYDAHYEENKNSYTNFSGYYILYKNASKDILPVHISTKKILDKLFCQGDLNKPLRAGENEMLKYCKVGIEEFDNKFMVDAVRSEDVKRLINISSYKYLNNLYEAVGEEFSIFFYGNGDIGAAIPGFNLFDILDLIKSSSDNNDIRNAIRRDIIKARLYIDLLLMFISEIN
jgi:hypothetical protein